jgi:phosphoribosylanthranilate isomerase
MIVKVCGMRDADNIRAVESLGVDWMGFIFYGHSSRNVETLPSYLPKDVKRVGVFVDEDPLTVSLRVKQFGLEIVQLHGAEDPRYIGRIRALCPGITVVKALSIASDKDLDKASAYFGMVEYFLFDTKAKLAGGNGVQFDWSILNSYRGTVPFILSGGIGPEDAARINAFNHPMMEGIDLNSRFETAPALKDVESLKSFLSQIKN